ncbi:hypothetical protein SAMN04515667_0593 [Formosa sp. Hel1_31_208]|uniref:hypothetical protein n=1 Tax=Formosa sp. Hel1_31_208 TaxID=1798225 RepID=UPI00087D9DAF|nr:hypothetical protein [Formosa sp. Hel1_31_208]SDR76564.1 hypothetical protein SAMN04515667_0593 [Formosa sp. Hel1_31_208]
MRTFVIILSAFCVLNLSSCATRIAARPGADTVIKTPPKHYEIVRVKGKRYYFWNNTHYRKTRKGYMIIRVY